eukprot:TRINITY_DN70896_c0_g2_i1.p1 TRINITY_DN70896_c0_g2~~TRINITY_DN70896_c0_g2_i1.p1  ORF type:complete len:683 (+),score=112.68 TRINITY_DN70896_c0_g2_i1:51-2099(+)
MSLKTKLVEGTGNGGSSHSSNYARKKGSFLVRHLPILQWLPEYKAEYLLPDVSGGVTMGLMCLSQTLAQAAIATTLPISGPYCAFMPPIVYAMLTTSRHASVSSGAMGCIIIASVLAPYDDIEVRTELGCFLALIAGIFQLLMGSFNLAFAVRFLSQATISGFVTGGAVLIMSSQLKNLFGYASIPKVSALERFYVTFRMASQGKANLLNLGFCVFLLVLLNRCNAWKRVAKAKIKAEGPGMSKGRYVVWLLIQKVSEMKEILAIGLGVTLAYKTMTEDGEPSLPIVGHIPAGVPKFSPPFGPAVMDLLTGPRETLINFIISGGMIAFTSFLTTYASNKKQALACGYELDGSQELFALGAGSAVGSFFGAFLCCGSLSRTALSVQLGVKTQVSGFVTAGVIALSLMFLSPILYYLPKASLAAIVLTSARGLMDFKTASGIWKSSKQAWSVGLRKDFIVWCVAFVCTILFGALKGICISVAVGVAQVVAEATAPKTVLLGTVPELGGQLRDIGRWQSAETHPNILVFEFRGPLCFCSAEWFHEELERFLLESDTDIRAIVLSFDMVEYIDQTAINVLKDILSQRREEGIFCLIGDAKHSVELLLKEKLGSGKDPLLDQYSLGQNISTEEAMQLVKERLSRTDAGRAALSPNSEIQYLQQLRLVASTQGEALRKIRAGSQELLY